MKVDVTAFVCGLHRARDANVITQETHKALIRVIYDNSSPGTNTRYEINYPVLLRILGSVMMAPWRWSVLWREYLGASLSSGIGVILGGLPVMSHMDSPPCDESVCAIHGCRPEYAQGIGWHCPECEKP